MTKHEALKLVALVVIAALMFFTGLWIWSLLI